MHLFHYSFSNLRLTLIELDLFKKSCAIIDREGADFSDALSTQRYRENFWL